MTAPARVRALRLSDSWAATWRHLGEVIEDVRAVLNGGVSVARHLDAVVHTFQWISSEAPIVVRPAGLTRKPLGVLVLDAKWGRDDEGGRASGLGIEWQYLPEHGELRVDAVLETIPATYYDVTILVLRS